MINLTAPHLENYTLLDTGDGLRLEKLGTHTIVRPDSNVIWKKSNPDLEAWSSPDARYVGKDSKSGWKADKELKDGWKLEEEKAVFKVKLTPFRHLGVFPEQAGHWEWLEEVCKPGVKVLNLFGYTGAASIIAAKAGAEVCHLDASAGSVNWAKENAFLSGLPSDAIRWIVDDARKFMKREINREHKYDLIIMDPPVFGRGPKGEIWRLETGLKDLADNSAQLLAGKKSHILVNFYATTLYPDSVKRVFEDSLKRSLDLGTLFLEEENSKKLVPTGYFLRS